MKNSIFNVLTQAIDGHWLLGVVDEAGPRVIEPYLIFESSQGDLLLHGWQRSGAYRQTPPPRWCNLHLDDLVTVEIIRTHFAKPHAHYNPASRAFHRVVYAIGTRKGTSPAPAHGRVERRRRGPPKRKARASSSRIRTGR